MAARVVALGCPSEKVHVIRLPADAAGLDFPRPPKADEFLVVAAGQFVEKKGFDTAIRSFAAALRGRPDARLMMLGGGPLETDLRRIAVAERVANQVVWRGRLPFAEFMHEISRARLALYPSRTAANGDSEGGAPVTLIEAQWIGVPSVVSRHDDLPFVAPPDGSFALPSTDISAWSECLRALYEDPVRIDAMASTAEAFVRRLHAPNQNREIRESLYASLAEEVIDR